MIIVMFRQFGTASSHLNNRGVFAVEQIAKWRNNAILYQSRHLLLVTAYRQIGYRPSGLLLSLKIAFAQIVNYLRQET